MASYIADYVMKSTNYSIVNIDNVNKLHIMTLEMLTDSQKFKYLDTVKFQMGITHYNELKMYIFRKFPNNDLLNYFKV